MKPFGNKELERDPGVEDLLEVYQQGLQETFGSRFLESSRTLCNSTGRPIFELLFCVGNPRAIGPAPRIAGPLLNRI